MRPGERVLEVDGSPVKPWWGTFTTAPETQPAPSELTSYAQHVDEGDGYDGYLDLLSEARMRDPDPVVSFHTALRVTGDSVPLVSLNKGWEWFNGFSSRFAVDFFTAASEAEVNVIGPTANFVALLVRPGVVTLDFDGDVIDITSQFHSLCDIVGVARMHSETLELHVIARRQKRKPIADRAYFDVKVVLWGEAQSYILAEAEKLLSTTEQYQAEFICKIA